MPTSSDATRLPVRSLSVGILIGCVVGAMVACGLAAAGGWSEGVLLAKSAAFGAAAVLAAGILGVAGLVLICGGDASKFAMALVACSTGRMLAALALALPLSMTLGLEARTFWASFLASAIVVLIQETAVGVLANRRYFSGTTPASGER